MNRFLKAVIQSLAALIGVVPSGGVPAELNPENACKVCLGHEAESKLLESSNNKPMRCPGCGKLIRPQD